MPEVHGTAVPLGKILNVDDTEAQRYAITRVLQRAGFQVKEAASGQECLELAIQYHPDLIILDVQLPDISGFEVCRRLKTDPNTTSVAVLHLSASFANSEDNAYGLEGGADGYLTQPVEPAELVAHVKALLRMRQAEEAAHNLARQWQITFDAISDGICLVNGEGIVVRSNQALERLLNKPRSVIIGSSFAEIIADLLGPAKAGDLVSGGRRVSRTTTEVTNLDGKTINIAFDPVGSHNEVASSLVCIFSDVTQRKLADAALRESDQRFRLLSENVKDYAILLLDPEGRVVTWNAGVARILGYDEDEIVGQHVSFIFTQEEQAAGIPEEEMRRAVTLGRAEGVRWHLRKDGMRFWADGVVTCLRDEQGNLRGFAKIMRDATEQKIMAEGQAEALQKQSRIAETLQRSMLLAVPADRFSGLSIHTLYEAALEEAKVGGDFCDAFALDGGRVALVVGDVSGKGLVAASRTAEVKYAFRAFLHEFSSPAAALARLNNFISEAHRLDPFDDGTFIVMAVIVLDTAAGEATFTMAGAEASLLIHVDGQVEAVSITGRPLGVAADAVYDETRRPMGPGDTFLMATDGITEARRGREFLGSEGMADFVRRAGVAAPLTQMGHTILNGARTFAGGSLRDDACLLLARLNLHPSK